MPDEYKLSSDDFRAIERGISLAHRFKQFEKNVEKIDVVAFDSTYIYIYSTQKYQMEVLKKWKYGRLLYRIEHRKDITPSCFVSFGKLPHALYFLIYFINHKRFFAAPPLSCFSSQQRKKKMPWKTKEDYMLLMINWFARVYHEQKLGSLDKRMLILINKVTKEKNELYGTLCELETAEKLNPNYIRRIKKFVKDHPSSKLARPYKTAFRILE